MTTIPGKKENKLNTSNSDTPCSKYNWITFNASNSRNWRFRITYPLGEMSRYVASLSILSMCNRPSMNWLIWIVNICAKHLIFVFVTRRRRAMNLPSSVLFLLQNSHHSGETINSHQGVAVFDFKEKYRNELSIPVVDGFILFFKKHLKKWALFLFLFSFKLFFYFTFPILFCNVLKKFLYAENFFLYDFIPLFDLFFFWKLSKILYFENLTSKNMMACSHTVYYKKKK